jgi:hypothetical protein
MADALQNLLPFDKYQEPAEVRIIKAFMRDNYQEEALVSVQTSQIIIQVTSSALAGTLRTHLHELQELCQTQKRLMIRIG